MASVSRSRPKKFQILKRKPKTRLFDWDQDHQWLWAAYRNGKGGFGEDTFPEDLSMEEFYERAAITMNNLQFAYLMQGYTGDKGVIPVGLAAFGVVEKHVEPHFYWFWWASPRNRYEAAFKFFDKLAEDAPFVIAVELDKDAFRMAEHLKRAGLMRRIGTSYNWEPNKVMALYETRDD